MDAVDAQRPLFVVNDGGGSAAERLQYADGAHDEAANTGRLLTDGGTPDPADTAMPEMLQALPDLVAVVDPESGEIRRVNQQYVEFYGYDRGDLRGLGFTELAAPAHDGETPATALREVGDGEGPVTVEWPVRTADGKRRWLATRLTRAVVNGTERIVTCERDVTERMDDQVEVERAMTRTDVPTSFHDPETAAVVEASQGLAETLGYEDRSAVLTAGLDAVAPVEADRSTDALRELVRDVDEQMTMETMEWVTTRVDGERRSFRLSFTPGTLNGERVVLCQWNDVTERRELERTYREVFESVSDGLVVHEPESGHIVDVNNRYCEMMGYDRDELIGATVDLITSPDADATYDRARELIQRAGEKGPQLFEWPAYTADDEEFPAEVHLSLVEIRGTERVLASVRDVTDRKRRERSLERTRRQFRQIVDAVDEVIHLVSPDLSETHYRSPGAEEVWGQHVSEMNENPLVFEGALHPEDREEHMAFLDRVSDELTDPETTAQDVYSYGYRIKREDGEVRWVDGRLYPIHEEDGGVTRVVSMMRDTTERQRRKQHLESFQAATTELTTADSTTEACHTAVDAAAEVFDIRSVAVHLFDDKTGRLEPTAATDCIGPVEDLPAWGSDDRIPWEAFVDERPIRTNMGDSPSLAAGPHESVLVMPLAGHGVVTVWTDEDDAVAETAHLVAATLEGALNHLVGRRRLESQREELEAQTERAEQMERVAELTRQIEAAITGQSHRVGVERAVCERLVDINPFVAAWTTEVEPGPDRLTPRTTAGIARERAEQAVWADDGRDAHPAQQAWQTGELAVERNLVGSDIGWRRDLLRSGVQAVCAIPLAYQGITHGVLVVHATSAGAFNDATRETLAQLGTSIGNAITAIERRRALESDETIELEFRATDAAMPFARLADATDCQVRHDRTVRRQDGSISVVYSVIGDIPDDVDAVAERTLPGEVEVISRGDDEVVVKRSGTMWFGSIISENGGILRRGHATPNRTTLVVELPTEPNTRRFVARVEETIPELELFAQRQHQPADTTPSEVASQLEHRLSVRQREALETAHKMGYFDWPRDHNGQAVAETMEITQPTLSKHLRIAERKVLDLILGDD